MANIQFDESQFKLRSRRLLGEPEVPAMIKFLVTRGIVRSEKQAISVLLTIVLVIVMISIFIIKSNGVQPAVLDAEYLTLNK
ncbi:MAG: hypothetical protein V4686_03605 [Patescibacteria group bacterium]